MSSVRDIANFLESFAPPTLAEDWDNVGLLVGDPDRTVQRVMTCLTVTPASLAEAVREQAELVVTHHPLPFRALKRITTETTAGRLLLLAMRHGIAIHSPHTAFDSARGGINQQLAEALGLREIVPLSSSPNSLTSPTIGTGRQGGLPESTDVAMVVARLKSFLGLSQLQIVGSLTTAARRVAVACGAAGSMLELAQRGNCDVFVTGEASFHTCLEAEATKVVLILTGHFASERFAVEQLARIVGREFSNLAIWPSRDECDPLQMV